MNAEDIYLNLVSLLFPKKCMSCGRIIENRRELCEKCEKDLYYIQKKDACIKCGLVKNNCDCIYNVYYFRGIAAPFANKGSARNIVYRYKFLKKQHYAKFLSRKMADRLNEMFPDVKFVGIVNVPTTYKSKRKKGFDHTELLTKEISKLTHIPFVKNAIGVRKFSKTQHKVKQSERFENAYGKYFVKTPLKSGTYLLADDIKTTGATLSACAKELMKAGATDVYCVTALVGLRKAPKPKKVYKKIEKNT